MRTNKEILYELSEIQEFLGKKSGHDMDQMKNRLDDMLVFLSSSASLVADAEYHYLGAKNAAFDTLKEKYTLKGLKMPPSLAGKYIETCIKDEAYAFTLAQRLNACCTHCIEGLRSILSAEKSLLSNLR